MSWWKKEADLLNPRIKKGKSPILLETGYGPSGLPHLGTFAEVARTSFVRHALRQKFPDIECTLIAFSDDMDGLRSVPENIPNPELVRPHLGKPLSRIPDPFGTHESFSGHMIDKLASFLDDFGFEVKLMRSSECYESGQFDEGLLELLQNEERIKSIVLPTLKPETRKTWSPFLPICAKCGRYTTRVTSVHPDEGELSYCCDQIFGGAEGCGYEDRTDVRGGKVKVGWKIDWALRWMMLGIDYEMFGKDLIESADISRKICRALKKPAPVGNFYELFLDEEGRKISKKIGNGISMDAWRSFAPDDAILNFLTKAPRKARRIGPEMVGRTTDELFALFRSEDEEPTEIRAMLQSCAPGIPRPHNWTWNSDIDFSLIASLVGALGIEDADAVMSFLRENEAIQLDENDEGFTKQLIQLALIYQREVMNAKRIIVDVDSLDEGQLSALSALKTTLEDISFEDAQELQSATYRAGKGAELNLRAWFGLLYSILTGNSAGPRLGTLLQMLGRQTAIEKLTPFLK